VSAHALLVVAAIAAGLSIPFSVLFAIFLAGADDVGNSALASILGVLLVPASVLVLVTVLALLRVSSVAFLEVRLLAPALLAAVAGPLGGPRSWHRTTHCEGDVVTSEGYVRPGDPGYPESTPPDRRRLLVGTAQMVGCYLVVPVVVGVASVLS
jgi:hypothetical protein